MWAVGEMTLHSPGMAEVSGVSLDAATGGGVALSPDSSGLRKAACAVVSASAVVRLDMEFLD